MKTYRIWLMSGFSVEIIGTELTKGLSGITIYNGDKVIAMFNPDAVAGYEILENTREVRNNAT